MCPRLPRIRACLFDMDGLLIDSEDKYSLITNEVLHLYGKPDLPWSIKAQLQGRPAPEVRNIPRILACSTDLIRSQARSSMIGPNCPSRLKKPRKNKLPCKLSTSRNRSLCPAWLRCWPTLCRPSRRITRCTLRWLLLPTARTSG